jgi:hypothetical protein
MVSLSDYTEGMMKRIDDMPESRLRALQEIEREAKNSEGLQSEG